MRPLTLPSVGFLCAVLATAGGAAAQRSQVADRARSGSAVQFRDVSGEAGLTFRHVNGASAEKHLAETMGAGGLFFDYDDDGWIDIFLVDGGSVVDPAVARTAQHRLFRNRRDGTFEDVTARSGMGHRAYGMGACAGDYDNDGHADLYVTNFGPNTLYRNAGDGRFVDVTATARVGSTLWGTSCAFVDVDRDGDLDLFVTNYVELGADANRFCGRAVPRVRAYCHPLNFAPSPNLLYRNDGGVFTDVTAQTGIADVRGNGLGVAVTDYDEDGWPDIFVANDAVANFLFHNEGNGRFAETALVAGVALTTDGKARAGMGTMFGDYDGDGHPDLVVTNHETEMHSLFHNLGGGLFADVTVASGLGSATLPFVGFGVVFLDYDNDADLDLSIVNGHVLDNIMETRNGAKHAQRRLLLQNTGGRFRDASPQAGPGFATEAVGRGLAAGDIDNDGDLDLLITNNGGRAELLRNDGGGGHALLMRLVGGSTRLTADPERVDGVGTRSNRDALGARVRLTAGPHTLVRDVTSGGGYLGQGDTRLHFGLGDWAPVDAVEIRWPSGRVEAIADVPADHIVTIREGAGVVATTPFVR